MLDRILCLHEHYDVTGKTAVINLIIHQNIEAASLAGEVRLFPYENMLKTGMHIMIQNLLREIKSYRPDALVFMVPFDVIHPLGCALQYIRKQYGTRLIAVYGDHIAGLAFPERHRVYDYFHNMADAVLSVDSTCTRAIYDHNCFIQGHPAVDLRVFQPVPGVVKDIDVSFVGSVSHELYDSRREYLEYIKPGLEEKGYRLYTGGGQYYYRGEQSISQSEYVDIMNRSKIVLNFSRTFSGFRQLKGRVMEAMACQAFVLTEDCPDIGKYFEKDKDYAAFDSKKELFEKILYYLEHENQREQIAASAYLKMHRLYTPRNAWGYIFKKMGFDMTSIDDENYRKYEKKMDEIQSIIDISYPSLHNTDYISRAIDKKQYFLAAHLAIQRLRLFPLEAENWFCLGKSLYFLGQYEAAKQAFERCSFLDPLAGRTHEYSIDTFAIGQEKQDKFDIQPLLSLPVIAFVTAVIITRDNEATIDRCLRSLLQAVDRIVVVDTGSRDNTVSIVKQCAQFNITVELLEQKVNWYPEALLLGIQQSPGRENGWILHVYPDEYLAAEDIAGVRLAASLFNGHNTVLNVFSEPVLSGTPEAETGKDIIVELNRLFPQKSGILINHLGIDFNESSGMINKTVKIRLYYDLAHNVAEGIIN